MNGYGVVGLGGSPVLSSKVLGADREIWVDDEAGCGLGKQGSVGHRAYEDADFGARVFEAGGGMELVEDWAAVRRMPKEYSQAELLREIAEESADQDAFYVVDLSVVLAKLDKWRELMPRVKPFYAVKCNNDEAICQLLASAGCGFDCASQAEILQVLDMGVPADKVIYANPCKQRSMLKFARSKGVRLMTADNKAEFEKIADVFPEARIVLRIAVDDSKSICRFNSKFGAAQHEWAGLMQLAAQLGLDIVGISFHVGSGCEDIGPFADAVASARDAFDLAESYGHTPTLLDCGGGFPGTDTGHLSFHDVAATIAAAVDKYFPEGCGFEIMAEPGRYMVAASHLYAVSVIAKRDLTDAQLADASAIESFGARGAAHGEEEVCEADAHAHPFGGSVAKGSDPEVALYINDGVYGSFNCVVFDHAVVEPRVLAPRAPAHAVTTKLFGPTCDSIDVVLPCTPLPPMDVGDWLYFPDMGAYTRCAASRFNGQGGFSVHYVWAR